MTKNFGDWQWTVYGDAVHGISSRFPFDFESIERKAFDAMPDWVYRYVSAAAGDGRTQRANIDAYSRYGIIPRMMVSPPERDLSINLFGNHLPSPMFMAPIGLIGLCSPDFHGDVAAAQASAEYRRAVHAVNVLPNPHGGRHQARWVHAQAISNCICREIGS